MNMRMQCGVVYQTRLKQISIFMMAITKQLGFIKCVAHLCFLVCTCLSAAGFDTTPLIPDTCTKSVRPAGLPYDTGWPYGFLKGATLGVQHEGCIRLT